MKRTSRKAHRKRKNKSSEKIQEVKKLCEERSKELKSFIWHRF